jgi:cytidylate kinase
MYRAVALVARTRGIPWDQEQRIADLAAGLSFRFTWDGDVLRILVDGGDVSRDIRTEEIGQGASRVSALPKVRSALLAVQRQLGAEGGVVMDGRDIGTVVLPNADLKVFLDADLDERARRRHEELLRRGETVSFEAIRRDLAERDERDRNRAVAPLVPAEDAIILDSTELTIRQVVERSGVPLEAIDLFVLHQANARIIEGARTALGIDADRFMVNLDRYGNTSSGSIPLAMDEAWRAGRIGPGSTVVVCGFGGGLAWGSAVWRL